MHKITNIAFVLVLLSLLVACQPQPVQMADATTTGSAVPFAATATETISPAPTSTPNDTILFAVIGDYGQAESVHEGLVAAMINTWDADFIVTTGDNNYPSGSGSTLDANIGQFYHDYTGNYAGQYGTGSETNRFFPSLGNHDWDQGNVDAYLGYFTLPGNERYYDFVEGPVHFFILDSDTREPDGVGRSSQQAAWLQQAMRASTSPWQVVVMHHPPYSSGMHGSTDWMQWPFADWGADVILSGHDHLYERLNVDGLTYITNGLGGSSAVYDFVNVLPQSQFRYNAMRGAMRVEATTEWMLFEFINVNGDVIDSFRLEATDANP